MQVETSEVGAPSLPGEWLLTKLPQGAVKGRFAALESLDLAVLGLLEAELVEGTAFLPALSLLVVAELEVEVLGIVPETDL